jgi:NitT/TauT family transport system permease protein
VKHRRGGRQTRHAGRQWRPRAAGAGLLIGLVLLLQLAVASRLISSFLVPRPVDVLASFGMLVAEEHLLQRFALTAAETLTAALLAALLGGVAGWAFYRWRQMQLAYSSWVVGLNAAPSLLLYPLFLVMFGRNAATIVALGIISALPPIVLKTCEGFRNSRRVLIDVGRSFDFTPAQRFRLIELPSAIPTIFSGVRIGLIDALITVVGIEFLIGYGGLGALIPDLADRFEIAATYGAILFVILVGAALQLIAWRCERWLRPG